MTIARDAAFWDRRAERYARARIADPGGYARTLARTASLLAPSYRVLEIGCGTGTTALRLAPGVASWLATDVSTAMIAIAGRKLADTPVPGLSFLNVPGGVPSAAGAAWDAAVAFNVLHLVRDLPGTLRALRAQLRPGALFLSKTPCLAEMSPLVSRVLLPAMTLLRIAPHVAVLDADALCAAIRGAGFAIEGVERHATRGRDARPFVVARAA